MYSVQDCGNVRADRFILGLLSPLRVDLGLLGRLLRVALV